MSEAAGQTKNSRMQALAAANERVLESRDANAADQVDGINLSLRLTNPGFGSYSVKSHFGFQTTSQRCRSGSMK